MKYSPFFMDNTIVQKFGKTKKQFRKSDLEHLKTLATFESEA